MSDAVRIVDRLTNVQCVSLMKQLHQNLYACVSYEEMAKHLPKGVAQVDAVTALGPEARRTTLDPMTSVEVSRQLLKVFAGEKALAPLVIQAWEEIREDDALFIEAIIAVGLIANLTLFMATTSFKFKSKNFEIVKGTADAKVIKEVFTPFAAVLKKIPVTS